MIIKAAGCLIFIWSNNSLNISDVITTAIHFKFILNGTLWHLWPLVAVWRSVFYEWVLDHWSTVGSSKKKKKKGLWKCGERKALYTFVKPQRYTWRTMVKEHFTVNESSQLSLMALIQGLCLSWADIVMGTGVFGKLFTQWPFAANKIGTYSCGALRIVLK